MASQLVAAALGALVLHAFFRAVEVRWPSSYFTLADVVAQRVSASLAHYLAFRLVPVAVVAFFITATLREIQQPTKIALLTLAMAHLGATTGRSLLGLSRKRHTYGFWSLVTGHAATVASVGFGVVAGSLLGRLPAARRFVPPTEELVTALWTAVLAGVLGAYVVRLSERSEPDAEAVLRRARKDIPDALWDQARLLSVAHDTEPAIVHAIMLTETIQRPPWMRRLENLKARLGLPGTYGVMQVAARQRVSDEESIRLSLERHLGGWHPERDDDGFIQREAVESVAKRHNRDETFVDMVAEFYELLDGYLI